VELRHLRYFTAIAELSSFTQAAERLHVTQPALSRQMRDLEEELGRKLFDRVNNGVRLTPVGRRFLTGAKRVLAESDALLASARGRDGLECPPLRIANFGTLSSQYFSPYLRKLIRRFPKMRLQVDEELPAVALRRVRAGDLDAAFTGLPEDRQLRGLVSHVVWVSPQQILVPANHRLAKRRSVAVAALRDERWGIWDEKQFPGFGRHIVQSCRRAGFRMQIAATLDSLAAIFIHVAEGDFISYGPPIARNLPHPGVVFIPTDPVHALDIPVALVWRPDSPHGAALLWLTEAMQPNAVEPSTPRPLAS
jgi:DNA-binding transcriptional LysR family regulator